MTSRVHNQSRQFDSILVSRIVRVSNRYLINRFMNTESHRLTNVVSRFTNSTLLALALVAGFSASLNTAHSQSVTKVADMNWIVDGLGFGNGPDFPKGRMALVGTNYWFLSEKGGVFGIGAVLSFDPATSNIVQIASLDNNTGKTPYGSMVVAGGKAWFTTERGGLGDRGTISYMDTNTLAPPTAVFSFPNNNNTNQANCGERPRSTPVVIGNELWVLSSLAGNNAQGSISKYDMVSGIMSSVSHFTGTNGGFPFGSLVQQGNAYYFTTHQGGTNIGSGFPNGAGTLGRVTFDGLGNPIVTKLIDLPIGNTGFPDGDVCPVGSNYLFFTTIGNTANPGSLIRYNVANNTWTNIYSFTTATRTNFGASPNSSTPLHVDGNLYFNTQNGGLSNRGVILKYNVANNTLTKLADFSGAGASSLGGNPIYTSATYVNDPNNCKKIIYMLTSRGGANGLLGQGTLVSINLFQPVLSVSSPTASTVEITWGGGYPPFLVQSSTNLAATNWSTVTSGLMTNRLTLSATNAAKFFRVSSPCP